MLLTEIERRTLMNQSAIMAALMNLPGLTTDLRNQLLEQYGLTGQMLRADRASMTDTNKPWPPRDSASSYSEGHQQRGSTGQLWQVHQGQWVRVPEPEIVRAGDGSGIAAI